MEGGKGVGEARREVSEEAGRSRSSVPFPSRKSQSRCAELSVRPSPENSLHLQVLRGVLAPKPKAEVLIISCTALHQIICMFLVSSFNSLSEEATNEYGMNGCILMLPHRHVVQWGGSQQASRTNISQEGQQEHIKHLKVTFSQPFQRTTSAREALGSWPVCLLPPSPPSMSNFVQPAAAELLLLFVACHVRIAEVAAVLRCCGGAVPFVRWHSSSRKNARNFAMCERVRVRVCDGCNSDARSPLAKFDGFGIRVTYRGLLYKMLRLNL